jgi:hypothetical protein
MRCVLWLKTLAVQYTPYNNPASLQLIDNVVNHFLCHCVLAYKVQDGIKNSSFEKSFTSNYFLCAFRSVVNLIL